MEITNLKKTARVTLKTIAEKVGLTPGTISAVLNNTRAAERIPQHTRDRVIAAAREMNYQPNPLARALRTGHRTSNSHAGEFSAARGALVIVGTDQFERALTAIQQAGLRVPDGPADAPAEGVAELCKWPAGTHHEVRAVNPPSAIACRSGNGRQDVARGTDMRQNRREASAARRFVFLLALSN